MSPYNAYLSKHYIIQPNYYGSRFGERKTEAETKDNKTTNMYVSDTVMRI